jgi:5,10-methylenetetrahydromethanopterin reductase
MVHVMRERIAVGEREAGRPEGSVGIVVGAVTVVDRDGATARALARREVAMYVDVVAPLDPTVQLPEGLLDLVRSRIADGDDEAAGRAIPDDVLDLFCFSGTPDQVAAQAQGLIDAGVSRVEFGTPQGLTTAGGIRLIGEAVIPQLDRG